MKLPIILSAMIAAFAISGPLASEATDEAKTEAAAPEAAPAAEKAPEAAKPAHKMRKHHRHHRHGSGQRHPADAYDLAFDDPNFPRGSDGSGCGAQPSDQGKVMPPEVPGQKGPEVPAGQ